MKDLETLEKWNANEEMWTIGEVRSYLEERVNNPQYYMYIGEVGEPLCWGQIKLDRTGYILSWLTYPAVRRRGFATKLAKMMAMMCGRPILAKINTNRKYSERVAINIGMVPDSGLLITNEKWWIRNEL